EVQSDGNVTLRVTVYSGHSDIKAAGSDYSRVLPDIVLPPGGFFQISGILQSNGVQTDEGYLRVERVSGTAPYHAYAVINDQFNSDGSFIPAVPEDLIVPSRLILPAIVETGSFASEVILTNSTKQEKHITLNWVSDSMLNTNKTTRFQTVLYPGEQQIIPNFVQY